MNGKQITIVVDAVVHEDCDLDALTDHLEQVFFLDDGVDLFPQLKVIYGIEVRAPFNLGRSIGPGPGDRWSLNASTGEWQKQ